MATIEPSPPPADAIRRVPRAARERDGEVRVLIVDDDDLFRAGLRAILEENGLNVVAEARRNDEALYLVKRLAADVVLVSIDMAGRSPIETTRAIAELAPGSKVVVLSAVVDPEPVIDALAAGACGYLAKDESVEAIAAGIARAAAEGIVLLSAGTTRALIDRVRKLSLEHPAPPTTHALSPRELQVLRLLADGHDNAEIAAALYISAQTVKHHVSMILSKLGVENRVQAAVRALRSGLV
jgi:DNA-binding NarL/FixJ family response regulator